MEILNIKVCYHSMTGNTQKVAEAIAEEAGVVCSEVSEVLLEGTVDLMFLGDGIYAGDMHASTKKFIASLDAAKVRNAAVFGTYGGQKTAPEKMKALLREKGLNVLESDYLCRGRAWAFINRKHPDEIDIRKAREFARKTIDSLNT